MTASRLHARTLLVVLAVGPLLLAGCGGAEGDADPSPQAAKVAALPPGLWTDDGRARPTAAENRPADPAYAWSGQRYATRAQLAHEETIAQPYTVVIDADDEAAVESALRYAEVVNAYGGGKQQMGVFVRSRQPALAARLAERLTQEQGWSHVFVVH